jgi:hypothetical protein
MICPRCGEERFVLRPVSGLLYFVLIAFGPIGLVLAFGQAGWAGVILLVAVATGLYVAAGILEWRFQRPTGRTIEQRRSDALAERGLEILACGLLVALCYAYFAA